MQLKISCIFCFAQYHVVVPLKPALAWEEFHDFARRVAEVMEQKWPDRYTSNVRKAKRTDKIFIDWIRNGRGATSIAPYDAIKLFPDFQERLQESKFN